MTESQSNEGEGKVYFLAKKGSGITCQRIGQSSRIGKIGGPRLPLRERFYPIDNIKLSLKTKMAFSEEFIQLYKKGWSLRDIADEYGCCKNRVRSSLIKAGIVLREKVIHATHRRKSCRGKQGAVLCFGFTYLDGEIVKDPREFPTLRLIHRLWRSGASVSQITSELNHAKIPSRKGGQWNRFVVRTLVKRFAENKIILHKGGGYEFR